MAPDTLEIVPSVVACHACDLLQREVSLPPNGGSARCRRCGAMLYRTEHTDRALAFALTAMMVLVISCAFPIASIEIKGMRNQASLPQAVQMLWQADMPLLALLVGLTTLLLPALELMALILLLWVARRPSARTVPWLQRWVTQIRPWGMVEVFMLGVLVSLVKLSHLAQVVPGLALWFYASLMVLMAAVSANFEGRILWHRPIPSNESVPP